MEREQHYRALEKMYLGAPINQWYKPRIKISKEKAEIEIDVDEKYFHSAGALHGSVYFKMLDDAAYFAVNSVVKDRFMVTLSFTVYFIRPVSSGVIRAVGKVISKGRGQMIAESVIYDSLGKEVGNGTGIFVKSNISLDENTGYNPD